MVGVIGGAPWLISSYQRARSPGEGCAGRRTCCRQRCGMNNFMLHTDRHHGHHTKPDLCGSGVPQPFRFSFAILAPCSKGRQTTTRSWSPARAATRTSRHQSRQCRHRGSSRCVRCVAGVDAICPRKYFKADCHTNSLGAGQRTSFQLIEAEMGHDIGGYNGGS
jgi:hypothetical protein